MKYVDCVIGNRVERYTLLDLGINEDVVISDKFYYFLSDQISKKLFLDSTASYMKILREANVLNYNDKIDNICKKFIDFLVHYSNFVLTHKNADIMYFVTEQQDVIKEFLINKIFQDYYKKLFSQFNQNELEELFFVLHNMDEPSLLALLHEDYHYDKLEEKAHRYAYQAFIERFVKRNVQACGMDCCDRKTMASCPKILDLDKKLISEYPFIVDGLQLIDSEVGLEEFRIYRCNRCMSPKKMNESKMDQDIISMELDQKVKTLTKMV